MSICSRQWGSCYSRIRISRIRIGSSSPFQAFQSLRCRALSRPSSNDGALSSSSSQPGTQAGASPGADHPASIPFQIDKPQLVSTRSSSTSQPRLPKPGSRRSARRIKWGLVDSELGIGLDTLSKDLGQITEKVQDEVVKLGDLSREQDAISDGLPLSPLMNADIHRARRKHRQPKPAPDYHAMTEFQTRLAKDPYARLLASPFRTCVLTHIRLPCDFLSSFSPVKDPRTGLPWLDPEEMSIDYLGKRNRITESNEQTSQASRQVSGDAMCASAEESSKDSSTESSAQASVGMAAWAPPLFTVNEATPGSSAQSTLSLYLLASSPAFDEVSSLENRQFHRLVPQFWKENHGIQPRVLVWRKDMPDYVLQQMRDAAMKGLEYLAFRPGEPGRSGKMYLAPVPKGWSWVNKVSQAGSFLWTGTELGNVLPGEDVEEFDVSNGLPPPLYAMLDWREHRTPIYNLPYLLGESNMKQLMQTCPLFQNQLIAVKRKPNSAGLQMVLWKIMGYLGTREKTRAVDGGDVGPTIKG